MAVVKTVLVPETNEEINLISCAGEASFVEDMDGTMERQKSNGDDDTDDNDDGAANEKC